jgi:hypothetical protein
LITESVDGWPDYCPDATVSAGSTFDAIGKLRRPRTAVGCGGDTFADFP